MSLKFGQIAQRSKGMRYKVRRIDVLAYTFFREVKAIVQDMQR